MLEIKNSKGGNKSFFVHKNLNIMITMINKIARFFSDIDSKINEHFYVS